MVIMGLVVDGIAVVVDGIATVVDGIAAVVGGLVVITGGVVATIVVAGIGVVFIILVGITAEVAEEDMFTPGMRMRRNIK